MTNFEKFKEQFEIGYNGNISDFIDDVENGKKPFNAEIKLDNTEDVSDSYDFTDERITKVYFIPEFEIFIEIKGTNQSYSGHSWDGIREVKQVTKTINEFEPVN